MGFYCELCGIEHSYSGFIYKQINQINQKWYIGSHFGCKDDGYPGSGDAFIRAVRKYGIEV